jgi:hypothetical protein
MADCWYLPSSTSGKTTITATFNGSPTIREILYFEVSGAVVSFSRDGVATNATVQTGSGTDDTGPSYTTHSTVGFVIGAVVVFNAVSVNPKAGNAFTAGGDIDATTGDAACSLISSSASSKQPVWTDAGTGQKYQAMTVAFQDGSSTVFDWMNQSRAEYPDRYRKIDLVPSGPMPGRGI